MSTSLQTLTPPAGHVFEAMKETRKIAFFFFFTLNGNVTLIIDFIY